MHSKPVQKLFIQNIVIVLIIALFGTFTTPVSSYAGDGGNPPIVVLPDSTNRMQSIIDSTSIVNETQNSESIDFIDIIFLLLTI